VRKELFDLFDAYLKDKGYLAMGGHYERREQFEEEGAHFESFYYLTFVWVPPAEDSSRAESWLYEGKSRQGVDGKELLQGFADRTGRILQLIEGLFPRPMGSMTKTPSPTFMPASPQNAIACACPRHQCISTRFWRINR
jgi:hypothetical protein